MLTHSNCLCFWSKLEQSTASTWNSVQVIFKNFPTHWSYKQVPNLFTRVPFGHPRCQGNLEHGVALHDLPQTEKNWPDFPDTEDPRLSLHQRSLVFLKDHGKRRYIFCMLLLKYFYRRNNLQLWLASPWQECQIKCAELILTARWKKSHYALSISFIWIHNSKSAIYIHEYIFGIMHVFGQK